MSLLNESDIFVRGSHRFIFATQQINQPSKIPHSHRERNDWDEVEINCRRSPGASSINSCVFIYWCYESGVVRFVRFMVVERGYTDFGSTSRYANMKLGECKVIITQSIRNAMLHHHHHIRSFLNAQMLNLIYAVLYHLLFNILCIAFVIGQGRECIRWERVGSTGTRKIMYIEIKERP